MIITKQNFQNVLKASRAAPMLLSFESPGRSPESIQLTDAIQTLSTEFEERFLLKQINIDTVPQITQAMQIPSMPLMMLVAQSRPMPLLQNLAPIEKLRQAITQMLQQLTANSFTKQHQPRSESGMVDEKTNEEQLDPRYLPAQETLEHSDIDSAVAEYQKLIIANPADVKAAAELAMAELLQRTEDIDLNEAQAAAATSPNDIETQTLMTDLDLLNNHVKNAFDQLVSLVQRTSNQDRNAAQTHLINLFKTISNNDPQIIRARQNLASALF